MSIARLRIELAPLALATSSALLLVLFAAPAWSGIHTWDVNEVFSNADGTIQFVELIDNGITGTEINIGNSSISSSLGTVSWSNGTVAPPTNGRHYLIATPAFAALPGAPTPDVIVDPTDVPIFDLNGDTVNRGTNDSLTFGPLPTNGTDSFDDVTGVGPNTPTNYAGDTGTVDASPPPSVPLASPWTLLLIAATTMLIGVSALRATRLPLTK